MIESLEPKRRVQYAARGSLKVTVTDCGPGKWCPQFIFTLLQRVNFLFAGLTADNLKRLFGEGVQFHANKLQAGGGSGLGLWIAKGVAAYTLLYIRVIALWCNESDSVQVSWNFISELSPRSPLD